ncbi:MAG TPA: alkane 1-monooxygenase [Bacteriovoracaceae bacterium]|nr:alkane 1-monooxygenase [Bacteriovoracaceae bacterium]
MQNFLPFLLPLTIVVCALFGIFLGGYWVYAGFVFAYFIHPTLDIIFGKEEVEPPVPESSTAYNTLVWVYLPIQAFFLLTALALCSVRNFSTWEIVGIILSLGSVTGGLGITIAHELIHRKERWERGLGVGLLLLVNYAHFRVEHVFGHHKHVATPLDPATARKGEKVYFFLVRSTIQSWISAWKIESKRLQRRSFIHRMTKHRIIQYSVVQSLLCLGVYLLFGSVALLVYLAQSVIAFEILEAINYVEHYGLQRKEISPGVYEPVTELHSWDSRHKMTNWFLFNLGRHAHHHASPTVPYEKLRSGRTEHVLRHGYSTEMLLTLFGKNSDPESVKKANSRQEVK